MEQLPAGAEVGQLPVNAGVGQLPAGKGKSSTRHGVRWVVGTPMRLQSEQPGCQVLAKSGVRK